MRRFITFMILAVLALTEGSAQLAELRQAAERYKSARSLTTRVTLTRHRAALSQDKVADGHFYYKKPNRQSMVFQEAGEMLLAVGDTLVMVKEGRQYTAKAKGKGGQPFAVLQDVFRHLLSAESADRLTEMADVQIAQQGTVCTLTLTPSAGNAKSRRRSLYSSCVAVIDLHAAELRSLLIREQGENYTRYDFSHYVFDAEVSDSVFNPQTIL